MEITNSYTQRRRVKLNHSTISCGETELNYLPISVQSADRIVKYPRTYGSASCQKVHARAGPNFECGWWLSINAMKVFLYCIYRSVFIDLLSLNECILFCSPFSPQATDGENSQKANFGRSLLNRFCSVTRQYNRSVRSTNRSSNRCVDQTL